MIGAGIIGLAIARELAMKGREVLVVESGASFGSGTSSRNSEVIHAGIYYPRNSLKASLCVKGRKVLYQYCPEHGIPYKQLGKLIVATRESEVPKLNELLMHGTENGVNGLRMIEASEAKEMEPELHCVKALLSPASGDIAQIWVQGEAESNEATISYNTTVLGGHIEDNRVLLHVTGTQNLDNSSDEDALHPELVLQPKVVVNSAGLAAVALAKQLIGIEDGVIPASFFARGCYFTLAKTKPPFQHLIYPIPEDGGLGVHVTLDLDGQIKFGPDVEWIEGTDDIACFLNRFEYSVYPGRSERFYPELRKYYPNLKEGALEPGYAGIQPKLTGPKQIPADFVIQGEDVHAVPGLVNLFVVEPGNC